MLFSLQFDV